MTDETIRTVYLDYAATTPVDDAVVEAMLPFLGTRFGNPNSLYAMGRDSYRALEEARDTFASAIGAAAPGEVVFTGCGTEADNAAVLGIATAAKARNKGAHIIVSAFEHHAVLEPAKRLGKQGFEVSIVRPREDGIVYPEDLAALVRDDTVLVSVMHGNNELGTVQPLKELAEVAHRAGAYVHTDAIQTLGKIEWDAADLGVDAASFSAHKIYGPKGVGALYLKRGTPFEPLLIGGGQESKKRSGTQNVAGIVGLTKALQLMIAERETESPRLRALRDRVIEGILAMPNSLLNGGRDVPRLPHIANLVLKGVEGESMLLQLDNKGIAVSTGSACSSGSLEPSHVLLAIGCPPEVAHGSLRVTVGRFTTEDDVDYLLETLPPIVERLRAMSPVYAKMFGSGA
ncbi:MAG: cysteine desulfurase family protein [Coriobacteriia bacterium]|nr:cysteine desulfurase family protein [Coriobacteriia bacterium]